MGHRSVNQRLYLFDGHVRPHTLRLADFLRLLKFVERVGLHLFLPDGRVQRTVQRTVIIVKRVVRYVLAFRMIFRQQISDVATTKVPVNLIQCDHFSGIVFQYAHGNLDLTAIFLTGTLLSLHINLHPIQQESLVLTEYNPGLITGQFDNTLRLDGIGGVHCRLILPAGVAIRFRDNIHLEVFICPLSVAVYIQIQALAAIAQRLHPKTNWLFDFCMILNSCHRDSFLIFSTANIRISIEFEKQMRNKIAPNKSQSTESTENNRK